MKVLKSEKFKGEKAILFFRRGFFWDCKQDKIYLDTDYDLVIERVLSRSANLSIDLPLLDSIYLKNVIKDVAIERSGQIFGNEQIEEISKHYKIQPEKFRRYFKIS